MPSVTRDGVEIYYETFGAGPRPLLLLSGLASDNISWGPAIPGLKGGRRLIAPDNRGCGRTTPQTAPVSIPALADDALAVLDVCGVDQADVLGHSMGGLIALDLAARFPARVRRLVLAASCAAPVPRTQALMLQMASAREAGMDKAQWFRLLFPWLFAPAFFRDPAAIEEAAALSVAYPFAQSDFGFRAQLGALHGYDALARCPQVRAPSLILCGGEDVLFTPLQSRTSFAAIADHRVIVLPDAAHSLHWDQPEAFNATVAGFLDEA
jgi:pimeloyl-ACP methyl ester carboxylesterase